MKKFQFPLERVLSWRRTLVRMEQIKLESMMGELRRLQGQAAVLQGERELAQRTVIDAPSNLGLELSAFESFRRASATQSLALNRAGAECMERIRVQREFISLKERDVRLLEKLREDRWSEWSVEQNKEIDQQAEESFLGRWDVGQPSGPASRRSGRLKVLGRRTETP